MPEKSREFAGNRALNLLWQRDYVRLHSEKQQFSVFVWFDRNFAFKCFLGDFHYNIEYLKIKKFHAHTVSNDGSFVAVTVQIVCSLSYGLTDNRMSALPYGWQQPCDGIYQGDSPIIRQVAPFLQGLLSQRSLILVQNSPLDPWLSFSSSFS